jgi:hypothetical protein
MSQTFAVDPNMVVSSRVGPSNPRHPQNILKRTMEIQDQAVEDTKFDASQKRVEGFMDRPSNGMIFLVFVGILLFFVYARTFRTVRMSWLLVLTIPLIVLGYIRNWEIKL